jgi:hypothetical protein
MIGSSAIAPVAGLWVVPDLREDPPSWLSLGLEDPSTENLVEGSYVTTMLTTVYISRGAVGDSCSPPSGSGDGLDDGCESSKPTPASP